MIQTEQAVLPAQMPKAFGIEALVAPLALTISIVLIIVINVTSLIPFFYFLAMGVVFAKVFTQDRVATTVKYFAFYSILAMALYLAQRLTYPDFIGLSGGFGIGTDDSRYYYYIADFLPISFPLTDSIEKMREYEHLMQWLAWFPINHPLDILFFNMIPLVLIPTFTHHATLFLTGHNKVALTAQRLIMFCPFLLSNSLILVRDGWVAMTYIGGLYCFLTSKFVKMGLLLVIVFVFRTGSGLLLLGILAWYFLLKLIWIRGFNRRLIYAGGAVLLGTVALLVAFPAIYAYLESKNFISTFFFREYFVSGFYATAAEVTSNDDSILVAVYQSNPLIRIIFGFIYFFMAPMFVPHQIVRSGIIVPRVILQNVFALLFIVYLKYFIQACFRAWRFRDWNILFTILVYVMAIFVLSQASIQIRHKVAVLPILYIIVAYGFHYNTLGKGVGTLAAALSALVQLGRTVLRLI